MPNYRFYTGHQKIDPLVIEFASDQEAVNKAKQLLGGLDVEVWQGARVVIRCAVAATITRERSTSATLSS